MKVFLTLFSSSQVSVSYFLSDRYDFTMKLTCVFVMLFRRQNLIVTMVWQTSQRSVQTQPLMMTKFRSSNTFAGQASVAVTFYLDLYLGGVRFASQRGYRHFWLSFSSFSSVPLGKFMKSPSVRPRPCNPRIFQFITHQPSHHSTLDNLDADSVVKWDARERVR